MITLKGIKKIYANGEIQVAALRGVDLQVDEGEFVAIMGPSGSGKSTMMNILGCLDRPTEGSYVLDGIDVSRASSDELSVVRNTKIGFVFQGFNLLARTTAVENVELPMLYAGVPAKERRERALAALESVGLGARVYHRPKELSGGQQQRVAVARALVNRPAIILADEPTGNLDTKSSIEVMAIFQRLHQNGNTIALVTHEPDIAEHTKRKIFFRDGAVESDEKIEIQRIADPSKFQEGA
ncbi:Phosphonate-transporting ATPase [Syntrophobotulus glycolicus DSM 8271]|uniref:Phosphonate-transporting ATPase n=1 Tax=Syntrophobotulus glycolicus (strain DSM 8271 / FlGlyR) TaxID=645991 RepID=F0SYA2_SYNGF|nr:ABC transporter ATP-binding protein [Syntrophobotulus glycolicus]ADY55937.1 Phosphonate-transporting ATPase [Syntrophobotulus glycolicus DSM 8271]